MPEFSYGFFPSISDIPTTNTPAVYNFIPIAFPIGTTVVLGITLTSMFFNGIKLNKFNLKLTFPILFIFSCSSVLEVCNV